MSGAFEKFADVTAAVGAAGDEPREALPVEEGLGVGEVHGFDFGKGSGCVGFFLPVKSVFRAFDFPSP